MCIPANYNPAMPSTDLEVTPHLSIPESELVERFVRASGAGGQNINKVSTAVELRFDIAQSPSLPEAVRARLLAKRDRRLTDDGVFVIAAMDDGDGAVACHGIQYLFEVVTGVGKTDDSHRVLLSCRWL